MVQLDSHFAKLAEGVYRLIVPDDVICVYFAADSFEYDKAYLEIIKRIWGKEKNHRFLFVDMGSHDEMSLKLDTSNEQREKVGLKENEEIVLHAQLRETGLQVNVGVSFGKNTEDAK